MKNNSFVKRYRHTGIVCKDIKKSVFFYKDILGMKIVQDFWDNSNYINKIIGLKNENVHMIKLKMMSGEILELISFPKNKTKIIKLPFNTSGLVHFAIEVSNLDKVYKKLRSKNVKFLSKPIISSEKFAKVCFCLDPNNVRIELVEILYKK